MELFKKIRLRIGYIILSNRVARTKREVRYSNFKDIRSIGIVWDASRLSEFATLSRFHQRMSDLKIDLKVFGYFPGKNLPDQYTAIRYLSCMRDDEINSFYHPHSNEASAFINKQFDILIDINTEKLVPLRYITSLSKASLKVGLFDNESSVPPFDLMMEIKNPVDIDNYLSQVIYYLEMIRDNPIKTAEK
jgi:hypothetical protein